MDNMPCTLIVPAAGSSKRFIDEGITKPKGLIRFRWTQRPFRLYPTMIEHVIPVVWDSNLRVTCKKDQEQLFRSSLPNNFDIHAISKTEGQADTVAQSMTRGIRGDVLVINCDNGFSIDLHNFVLKCRELQAVAGAVVFKSDGELRYGYVDNAPMFNTAIEKVAITDYALAGAFYFKSTSLYLSAYKEAFSEPISYERYISHVFQYIVGIKHAYMIDRKELFEWGTPELLKTDKSLVLWEPPDA